MNEMILTPRQKYILNLISQQQGISRAEIESRLENLYPSSKPTVARELAFLHENNLIRPTGSGPNIIYQINISNPLLRFFDADLYFATDPDVRSVTYKNFNFNIFSYLKNIYPVSEISKINLHSRSFAHQTNEIDKDILKKELERFIIELAWKSSSIEGNTYNLLDTEALIKQNIESKGHTKEEAVMILNHKQAFDMILSNKNDYKKISVSSIKELHSCLMQGLSITTDFREHTVGITGTIYKPPDNRWQIQEAIEKTLQVVNSDIYTLEKALITSAMISYIQPFADGNKRTGRLLANAILLANDYYPLSYRSVNEVEYKKALILFYEQNSIYLFKKIFTEQYLFALKTYFK